MLDSRLPSVPKFELSLIYEITIFGKNSRFKPCTLAHVFSFQEKTNVYALDFANDIIVVINATELKN